LACGSRSIDKCKRVDASSGDGYAPIGEPRPTKNPVITGTGVDILSYNCNSGFGDDLLENGKISPTV